MNRTTNYNLCQFEETDRVQRTDFNEDNVKIDAAVKAVDRRVDGLEGSKASTSALNSLVNRVTSLERSRIHIGSYVGDGANSRTINLPWTPDFMILFSEINDDDAVFFLTKDHTVYINEDGPGTSTIFIPKLNGSRLITAEWGNQSGRNCFYILFR